MDPNAVQTQPVNSWHLFRFRETNSNYSSKSVRMRIIIAAAKIKHTTPTMILFFCKLAFVLLVLQSSSFCRIRNWNNHSFIDQSEMLHTVSLVFCSFRERRMISSPSCTRYDKRSSLIFWPLKCGFDQLTQIPLWVFALFLCRSSGKSNQLLFLAYWFSLSQPTGGIKKWNVQHNLRYSLQFIGNWHILVAADDNTAEICIV